MLYGKAYESELERMQTQIDHFRLMLEHRAAAAIDQATKAWALDALWPPYSEGITLLPVLNLRLGFNTGVTFGMFAESAAGAVWLLVGIKLAVVAWLLLWLRLVLLLLFLRRLLVLLA